MARFEGGCWNAGGKNDCFVRPSLPSMFRFINLYCSNFDISFQQLGGGYAGPSDTKVYCDGQQKPTKGFGSCVVHAKMTEALGGGDPGRVFCVGLYFFFVFVSRLSRVQKACCCHSGVFIVSDYGRKHGADIDACSVIIHRHEWHNDFCVAAY